MDEHKSETNLPVPSKELSPLGSSLDTTQINSSIERMLDDHRQTIDRQRQMIHNQQDQIEQLTDSWNTMTLEYENRLAALRNQIVNLTVQNTALGSLVNERGATITRLKELAARENVHQQGTMKPIT